MAAQAFFFAAANARERAEWVEAVSKSARKTPGLGGVDMSLHGGDDDQDEDEEGQDYEKG